MEKRIKKGSPIKRALAKLLIVTLLFVVGLSVVLNSQAVTSAKESVYAELQEKFLVHYSDNEVVEPVYVEVEGQQVIKEFSQNEDRNVEEIIWDYLRSHGFTEIQTAGIIGNMYAECGLDPAKIERGSGIGIGLLQWSFGRRTNFENYAGNNWKNLNVQLDYFMREYNGAYGSAWTQSWLPKFENATTAQAAAEAFCWGYERPNAKYAHLDYRIQKANDTYNNCHGRPVQAL